MKPTSPEDQELEKSSSEVSEHYRAAAQDEPPSRLDAAVLEAARRDLKQPARRRRDWQIPASIAAMVIIGVAMALLVRENQAPPPSLDAINEARLAKQTPPQMAMKTQPKANTDSVRERPSRERSPRPDRTLSPQGQTATAARDSAVQANVANRAAAAAPASAPAKPAEAAGIAAAESKKPESMSDAAAQSRRSDQALLKQKTETPMAPPEDWLRRIDDLLREGKNADAREQVQVFQKAYPDFVLPQRFQGLLVEQH